MYYLGDVSLSIFNFEDNMFSIPFVVNLSIIISNGNVTVNNFDASESQSTRSIYNMFKCKRGQFFNYTISQLCFQFLVIIFLG
jgi:hypothetical protein